MTEKQREMIDRIKTLRADAVVDAIVYPTNNKSYEWEIGIDVMRELDDIYPVLHLLNIPEEKLMLMGYPVRVNREDTHVIKLWAEVK